MAEVAVGCQRARIIATSGLIVVRSFVAYHICATFGLFQALLQTIALSCSCSPIFDHLKDFGLRAWSEGSIVTRPRAVVRLEKAGVRTRAVGRVNTSTSIRFPHHKGCNKSFVQIGLGSHLLDGGFYGSDLGLRVLGPALVPILTGLFHYSQVGRPESLERQPLVFRWPPFSRNHPLAFESFDVSVVFSMSFAFAIAVFNCFCALGRARRHLCRALGGLVHVGRTGRF